MCDLVIPEYLYHYTSVDILALILKNRTIRLNPLSKLDDKQEQKSSDTKNIGSFIFVSSWTSEVDESIPMWKMYTKPDAGVRIRLKSNPFLRQKTAFKDIASALSLKVPDGCDSVASIDTFLDISKLVNNGYFSAQAWGGDILKKVIYTDDLSLLEPKLINSTKEEFQIIISKMGIYKNTHWQFQNEWRYLMSFFPLNLSINFTSSQESFKTLVSNLVQGIEIPPFEHFDLELDPDVLKDMEITFSPEISVANKTIVETLIQKYNPSATLKESILLGNL